MRSTHRALPLLALLLAAAVLAGCGAPAAPAQSTEEPGKIEPKGKVYYSYFDTVSYVYDYSGDTAERFDDRSAAVSSILAHYHELLDIYHEYSGVTGLCAVNKAAGGEPLAVDPDLMELLLYAKEMYALTGGQMNVMLGAVLRPWHACREAAGQDPSGARIPSEEELREAGRHTDIELLELDPEAGTVRIADPEASIDVGALGKGYATEMAARYLEEQGAAGYVLNIGGNIRIIGDRPDGSGWRTGVRDPADPDGAYALYLRIRDIACVSSGVYERFFVADGQRYHHIIDPDTLYPANYYAALTVLTRDSGLADALSTALFCMPYAESLALAESLEGVEVCWIFPDGEQRFSSGFEAFRDA
ncbi:MAG: FAD:protein FMN transferase [Oscillospiraceae bacterium]|nr:FAD:protein FMN transferase [Oscillospiraceae bacterium]